MAAPGPGPLLVDHHCHGVLRSPAGRGVFESLLTESDVPAAPGTTFFDTQLGFAVRRLCPPLLGLAKHCSPRDYLARRQELGVREVGGRLLRAAGIGEFLVDTGLPGDLTEPAELAELGGGTAREIVRLETLAERVADTADEPEAFLAALDTAIRTASATAAGFKSIAAYRHGLRLDPAEPAREEALRAAAAWLDGRRPGTRLADPTLHRLLIWSAARTGLPLQLHTGFGDPDLRLQDADPLLLSDLLHALRPTGCAVVLLHGYPYHRLAGYLAHVHPHVHADVGLSLTHTGTRASAVLAELLELTPFGKLLFSTDAYGLPELYVVGAHLFRTALAELTSGWVAAGAWSRPDADRVARLIGADNARRVYGSHGAGAVRAG
ncbi:amidohydrolase family protein [Streptomyces sp. B-S-A8]|uniref:Amidohydrolase family protein n=1 Tax=Streptomyces solicavernae TaxID=3043614 RepID=A0ABT6RQK9_9ACTN|nr:amidohydrolase family protein [Streptomyces sp. B-S-A8]MDI3386721.1 amidohydrolase family protein [Streptomyces sp. B-S-A8]